MLLKNLQCFPSGLAVKTLPASAWDTGSILGPGRFHMRVPQLLSLCTVREAAVVRSPHTTVKSSPHSPQLRSAKAVHSNEDPSQSK